VVADGQLAPGLQDEAVLDGAGDRAHVHDFVRADKGGELCVHYSISNWLMVVSD
jgi:hypothetical protein